MLICASVNCRRDFQSILLVITRRPVVKRNLGHSFDLRESDGKIGRRRITLRRCQKADCGSDPVKAGWASRPFIKKADQPTAGTTAAFEQ